MRLLRCGTFAILAFIAAPAAHADDLLFTLTSGSTTISFTHPALANGVPESAYDGFYYDSIPVDINGTVSNQEVAFYTTQGGGGLSIEDPDQGQVDDHGTGLLIDQTGSALSDATINSINDDTTMFIPGSYNLTNLVTSNTSPLYTSDFNVNITDLDATAVTPEPSSLVLLSTGLIGMAGVLRRRYMTRQ